MSVVVTIHFPVSDVAKAIEGLHGNAEFLEEIPRPRKTPACFTTDSFPETANSWSLTNGKPRSNSRASSTGTLRSRR